MTLAEELGYDKDARLLIINADDYGLCHTFNTSVQTLLQEGAISSATVMMPCGWAPEAAKWCADHPQYDVGVHFTFTSEWDAYKWGPVSHKEDRSSLTTDEGYFHKDVKSFEEHADAEQVKGELIAQIQKAISLGINPSHADSHMGSLYGLATGRHFIVEALEVCAAYGLPFRLPRHVQVEIGAVAPPEMEEQSKAIAALADTYGVVILDYLLGLPFQLQDGESYESFKEEMKALLKSLKPGVTELIIHPAEATDELRAFHREPEKRDMEFHLFRDPELQGYMKELGIVPIRWTELQQLQRSRKKTP